MGQCMEERNLGVKIHPSLGPLAYHTTENKDYLILRLALPNEEVYIQWSKKINKLRYHPDIKQHLYTPLREEFKTPKGFCQASNYLQMLLEPYDETLAQIHRSNIERRRYPSESLLWKVLLVLSKYLKYKKTKLQQIDTFELENVLSWSDGRIKIIPPEVASGLILRPQYDIQIEEKDLNQQTHQKIDDKSNQIYQIAMICLCLADLLPPSRHFDQKTKRWKKLQQKQRSESLKNVEMRYSNIFTQTLKQMLDPCPDTQISSKELTIKLENFDSELFSRRQLQSMIGLNLSLNTPMKNSNIFQTKLNNCSNLLKLSQLKYDPTDKASTNMQLDGEAEDDEQDVRSLQIL